MITVLIETLNDDEKLARTLASLVSASVEGVVRDVVVCDRGSTDETHRIADVAGCEWIASGGVATGLARARGDWVLLLEPGATMADGWIEPAMAHCVRVAMAATFTNRQPRPMFSRMFARNRALATGLLIRKAQAVAQAKSAKDSEGIARGIAVKQLAGGIYPAES